MLILGIVFAVDLLAIEGVGSVPPPSTTTAVQEGAASTTFPLTGAATTAAAEGSEKGPQHTDDDDSGECKLLGPFALLVQGALGILAVSSLVFKRWRETPRRPLKVWSFDASKQVVGSALLHLANLLMSIFSSGQFDITHKAQQAATAVVQGGKKEFPNPCSFYLLNLAIDVSLQISVCHVPKANTIERQQSVFPS